MKIFKTIIILLTLTTITLQANSDIKKNVNFHVGTVNLKNSNQSESIVGLEVSIYKKIADNLYLGIGGESQFFNNGRAVDLYPSISYDITPNLSANATVGYTLGEINDISYTGVSSSIGLNYAFNKKYGVGIRYKNYSIDYDTINGDIPDTLTATTISFNQKF